MTTNTPVSSKGDIHLDYAQQHADFCCALLSLLKKMLPGYIATCPMQLQPPPSCGDMCPLYETEFRGSWWSPSDVHVKCDLQNNSEWAECPIAQSYCNKLRPRCPSAIRHQEVWEWSE